MTFFKNQVNQWTVLLAVALAIGLFGCSSTLKQDTPSEPSEIATEPNQTVDPTEKITLSLAFTAGMKSRYEAVNETTWTIETPETVTMSYPGSTSSLPTASESSVLVFTQEILGPAPGAPPGAVAKVTIERVAYTLKLPGQADLTCDSRDTTIPANPLVRLVGKTYTIGISPLGYVPSVFNLSAARQAVRGSTRVHNAALDLLDPARIFIRHGSFNLPGPDVGSVALGDRWRGVQQFTLRTPFQSVEGLGTHRFEKIYRLERIDRPLDGTLATVAFEGSLMPKRRQKKTHPEVSILSCTYAGGGQFNVDAGCVDIYADHLEMRLALSRKSILPIKKTQGNVVILKRHFQTQRLSWN